MTLWQQLVTIGICSVVTLATRFVPFFLFSEKRPIPKWVQYLGKVLPGALFGMLVVYCFRHVDVLHGSHGLPEAIALAVTVGLHLMFKKMMVSIFVGTVCYMVLLQLL